MILSSVGYGDSNGVTTKGEIKKVVLGFLGSLCIPHFPLISPNLRRMVPYQGLERRMVQTISKCRNIAFAVFCFH